MSLGTSHLFYIIVHTFKHESGNLYLVSRHNWVQFEFLEAYSLNTERQTLHI